MKSLREITDELYAINHSNFDLDKTTVKTSGKIIDQDDIYHMISSVLDGTLTASRYADLFSDELTKYTGINYCALVNSGSSANLLALSALCSQSLGSKRLLPGDEVICVAAAFATSVFPILQNGLVPVFVDINIEDLNPNLDLIKEAVSEKTKAVFIAHTLGCPTDLERLASICKDNGLYLIEDCCDALGSRFDQHHVGSLADVATLSFYPAHHITSGEGGAVLTNNKRLNKIICSLRDWGRDCWCIGGQDNSCGKRFDWKVGRLPKGYDHKFIFTEIGYNLKMTDIQAACGYSQMLKAAKFEEIRRSNVNILSSLIFSDKSLSQLFVNHAPISAKASPCWFGFPLTIKDEFPSFGARELSQHLNKSGIMTRPVFSGNITMHPAFDHASYKIHGSLDNTNYIMENTLWVGISQQLEEPDMRRIYESLKEFAALAGLESN